MPRVRQDVLSIAEVESKLREAERQKEMLERQKIQLQYAKQLRDVAAKILASARKDVEKYNLNYRDLAQEIMTQVMNEDASFMRNGYDY